MKRFFVAAFALISISSVATAQLVVPILPDDNSGLNTMVRNAPRAYQMYIAASQLGAVVAPTQLTGFQIRLANDQIWRPAGYVPNSWPDQPINFADYTVELSRATPQLITDGEYLSLTPTFDSYQDGGLTQVMTGPLTIPAGCMDGTGAGAHAYGCTIPFDVPYTINPGDTLVMEVRHSGYGTVGTPLQAFIASHGFVNGAADAISSTVGANAPSPNGFSSPTYVRFVPEPSTLALLGFGALALIRRKR